MAGRAAIARAGRAVAIVSDESSSDLRALRDALGRRGLTSEVVPAGAIATRARGSVVYIRRLDPGLLNQACVADAVSRLPGASSVNTPESVRAAEWLPLASAAFRAYGVPQPHRVWCVNDRDLRRAARQLGFPAVAEGTVSGHRALVHSSSQLPEAVETVRSADGGAGRGVFLEHWPESATATVAVLVVGGHARGFCFSRGSDLRLVRARSVQEVAVRAVGAVGGTIMAAIVVADRRGNVCVRRVDAAPHLGSFGRSATGLVATTIARRLHRGRRAR